MKKTKTRILSLILALVMVVTMLPDMSITARADGGMGGGQPWRSNACEFVFDSASLTNHGVDPSEYPNVSYDPSKYNGTILVEDFDLPYDPVSNDGAEFAFWLISNQSDEALITFKDADYGRFPYEEINYMDNLESCLYEGKNTTFKFKAVWKDELSPKNGYLVLGDESFRYEFKKDGTYVSDVKGDSSGNYKEFLVINESNDVYRILNSEPSWVSGTLFKLIGPKITPDIIKELGGESSCFYNDAEHKSFEVLKSIENKVIWFDPNGIKIDGIEVLPLCDYFEINTTVVEKKRK